MTVERFPITDRTAWLELRKQDLTASDLGGWLGVDRYRTPLRIFREKRGEVPPVEENNIMRRGRWLEAAALEALRETYPTWTIERPGIYLRDDECRLGATPDAIANGNVNVQIKTVTRPAYERDWADGSAPLSYVIQTMAEGYLLDAARSLLVALVIDTYSAEIAVREVPRHVEAEARIRQVAREFWEAVESGRAPAPDYARDGELLIRMLPPSKDVPAPLDLGQDNRVYELAEAWERFAAAEKTAKESRDAVKAELVDKLKGAESAIADGWRVTYRMRTVAEHMVKASQSAVMTVTRTKEHAA